MDKLYKQLTILNSSYEKNFDSVVFSNFKGTKTLDKILIVNMDDYIEFNWLLLASCSLWYCDNKLETEIRIDKIFSVLEKLDFIEEQVLMFIFLSIYKYGSKEKIIKMFEYLYSFLGYCSYTHLSLLCSKPNDLDIQNEKNEKDQKNNIKQEDKNMRSRYFFNITDILKSINKSNITDKEEEITFYTSQKCPRCTIINDLKLHELIHKQLKNKKEKLCYQCPECKKDNIDIFVRYQIILKSKKMNESFLLAENKFRLIAPDIIYQSLKEKCMYLDELKLDIDKIFKYKNIFLLNNIFYFSSKMMTFDFLIPYEDQENREFFEEEEYKETEENVVKNEYKIDKIDDNNFSLCNNK
jgi:hypothetical protein